VPCIVSNPRWRDPAGIHRQYKFCPVSRPFAHTSAQGLFRRAVDFGSDGLGVVEDNSQRLDERLFENISPTVRALRRRLKECIP
jgi:hypothetical protein